MKRMYMFLVFAVCMLPSIAWTDEAAQAGRSVIEKASGAVVTVRLVTNMKMSMPGMGTHEEQNVTELTGTVIGSDGLTVVSLFSTDPSSALQNFMGSMAGDMEGLQIDSRVKELTILMSDRREIPGKIVLRDKELDLAFIRPVQPATEPFVHIDLGKGVKSQLLDNVLVVYRLGKVARRSVAGSFTRIEAIIEKPRLTYVLPVETSPDLLGAPAFALDSACIGLIVERFIDTSSDTAGPDMATVIIPAADVLEVAAKAPVEAEPESSDEENKSDQNTGEAEQAVIEPEV